MTLPDYQGVGIGNAVSECARRLPDEERLSLPVCDEPPAMIRHRANSERWRLVRFGHEQAHKNADPRVVGMAKTASAGRLTASFEYVSSAKS